MNGCKNCLYYSKRDWVAENHYCAYFSRSCSGDGGAVFVYVPENEACRNFTPKTEKEEKAINRPASN